MFDHFTERAKTIISHAADLCADSSSPESRTKHFLTAMIAEPRGIAGHVFRDRAVDANSISATPTLTMPDATLSEIANAATSAAVWLGHHYPGTEHLLLGLCNLPHSHAFVCLQTLEAPPLNICQDVLEILGHHDDWERWQRDHVDNVA